MSSAYQVNPQKVNATPNSESIMGVVERLTYHSEESAYRALVAPPGIGVNYNYGQLRRYTAR